MALDIMGKFKCRENDRESIQTSTMQQQHLPHSELKGSAPACESRWGPGPGPRSDCWGEGSGEMQDGKERMKQKGGGKALGQEEEHERGSKEQGPMWSLRPRGRGSPAGRART